MHGKGAKDAKIISINPVLCVLCTSAVQMKVQIIGCQYTEAMDLLLQLLTVAGLGLVALWAAIPTGLAFDLPPVVVAGAAGLGSVVSMILVIALGAPLRAWLLRRYGQERAARP